MGDFNDMCVKDICDSCSLNQVVKIPTRKDSILDLILTNKENKYYRKPASLPQIGNSDHLCVLYVPVENENIHKSRTITTTRIFHKSAIIEFGAWLTKFNWNTLRMISDVNQIITRRPHTFLRLCGS